MLPLRSTWILTLLLAVPVRGINAEEGPLVKTSLGAIRGVWEQSTLGSNYAAFLGIPYAKPPVGELRFEPPQPPDPWMDDWDGSSPPPLCLAWDHRLVPNDRMYVKGQEDCLYLNVYTPKLPSNSLEPMDVIIFFHAGAFMFGTSSLYGAKKLMDYPMVFVSINYRLGPLGFLSFGDDVQPGNNGMRDQVLAMKWVRKYIHEFGGNPKSITLMGMSAGGSSVHYHYLSPLSKGLFHRGVSFSGTALCRWALTEGVREKSLQLASSVGCDTSQDSTAILRCMKQRPADRIVGHVGQFQVWQYSPFSPFGPVVESRGQKLPPFLPDTPFNLLKRGEFTKLPWVTGVDNAEGLYPVATFISDPAELERLDVDFKELVPHLLDFNRTVMPYNREQVIMRIRQEYFGDKPVCDDTVKQVIKMVSDRMFVVDAQRAATVQASFSPVYFFYFTFRGKYSLSNTLASNDRDYGTSHGDDVSYLLQVPWIPDVPRTGMEKQVEDQMLELITNFVKNGVPTSDGVTWNSVEPEKHLRYLLIDKAPSQMAVIADLGNSEFWDSLPIHEPEQCPHTGVTETKDEL